MPAALSQSSLDPKTLDLLSVLESTRDESRRSRAIEELAQSGSSSSCRVLLDAYQRSMWRSTKCAIIRALGRIDHPRGCEFLFRIASNQEDLSLGSSAVLALGATNNPIAGEFLLTVLEQQDHPLRREAILALSKMTYFPCDRELSLLLDQDQTLSPSLLQDVILSLSRRVNRESWSKIERYLELANSDGANPVFNAALIAAGQLGGQETLEKLRALETPTSLLSNELRLTAIDRIRIRLRTTLDEVVRELLNASRADESWQDLRQLRLFPCEAAWDTFQLLGSKASVRLSALVRVILFDPRRAEEDLKFLSTHAPELDLNLTAALLLLHGTENSCFAESLRPGLPLRLSLELLARVRTPSALTWLEDTVASSAISHQDRVLAVNAMVAQAQMAGRGSVLARQYAEALLRRVEATDGSPLRPRLVRSLGQIGADTPKALATLENLLEQEKGDYSSTFAALAAIGGEHSSRIVLKQLKRMLGRDSNELEIDCALAALAKMGKLPEVSVLENLAPPAEPSRRLSLLIILTSNRVRGLESLVNAELLSDDFRAQVLAVAAARFNHTEQIWKKVTSFLASGNAALAGRALDSICTGGGLAQHQQLLERITLGSESRETALKALQSLTPEPGSNYQPLIAVLNRWLASRRGVFADREVAAAALNLRDNLVFHDRVSVSSPSSHQTAARPHPHLEHVDQALADHLPGFASYGEMVKSALRNAELTYLHPELFGEQVDKSTVIVEYVKSIDILLQQKLGGQIFSRPGLELISRMQSRLIHFQLHEESLPIGQMIRELECGAHFDAETFPTQKLRVLTQNILSGKITHDKQRAIDGPRAWAVILLLYAREFTFRSTPVRPLLKMRCAPNQKICHLAFHLNALQENRNEAAHRGTMLQASEVEVIRQHSFEVLTELGEVLE